MTGSPSRWDGFAALDWSGAAGPRQPGIAIATCRPGDDAPVLVRPGHVWSRDEAFEWTLATARAGAWLIGFDLSPAFPFLDASDYFPGLPDSPPNARALWTFVDDRCRDQDNLGASRFADRPELAPYFRRHGQGTGAFFGPDGHGRLRATERAQRERLGLNPTSCFNLVGASQVGKASLTGMRLYRRLDGTVPLWPFDPRPDEGSVVVEIYTTVAAQAAGRRPGRAKIRTAPELDEALRVLGSQPAPPLPHYRDHATDALVSAAWLRRVADEAAFWSPDGLTEAVRRTEGWTFGVP